MRRKSILKSALCLGLMVLGTILMASTPTVMNYQGRLTDNTPSQNPINTTVDITFNIHDDAVLDNVLWTESWVSVPVNDGIFSVLLGSNGTPLDPALFAAAPDLWMELIIDGETLAPRQKLGSVGYAFEEEAGNEYNTGLTLNGTTLELTDGDGTLSTSLASLQDGTGTDDQILSFTNPNLSIEDGNTVDLSALSAGDNLGNHTATTTLNLNSNDITNAKELYMQNWIRWADNDGMYWSGNGWHLYPKDAFAFRIRSGNSTQGALIFQNGSSERATLRWDANVFELLKPAGNNHLRTVIADGISPNLYFYQASNETWSGDLGVKQGKIEYNSDRFFLVSGSDSAEIVRFRRNNTDVARIDNSGNIIAPRYYDWNNTGYYLDPASSSLVFSLNAVSSLCIAGDCRTSWSNAGDNLGNHTATSTLNLNSNSIANAALVSTTSADSYDKLRVYNSSNYTIGMKSAQTFGALGDWAMTFTMNNDSDRGWLWRDTSDSAAEGAMSLTTTGVLTTQGLVNSLGGLQVDGQTVVDNGAGWHRTTGNTGWYNQTYGGGWYMTDSSYVRSYNNKGVVTGRLGVLIDPVTDIHLKQTASTQAGTGGITLEDTSDTDRWKIYHSGIHISFAENGVRQAYITGGSGAYVQVSDRNLKTDLRPMMGVLDRVLKLEPFQYRYLRSAEEGPSAPTLGFMAQDVEELFPALVKRGENGELGLAYSEFGVVAIAAIQEQQQEINELKKQVAELKALVEQLAK